MTELTLLYIRQQTLQKMLENACTDLRKCDPEEHIRYDMYMERASHIHYQLQQIEYEITYEKQLINKRK